MNNKLLHLYIIRHAETDYNRLNIVQGSGVDTDLNEHGKWQAQRFYEAYKNISFEKIYCSALKRTYQTIESFIKNGMACEQLAELNEMNWGIHEGERISVHHHTDYVRLVNVWKEGRLEEKIQNGESPMEVQVRIRKAVEKILDNHLPRSFGRDESRNILICTHGRAIRILLATVFDFPLTEMDRFGHQNTSVNVVVYDGKKFEAEKLNDVAHLK